MNCARCKAPLEINARFCRNCGLPVQTNEAGNTPANISPLNQSNSAIDAPTIPPTSWQAPQPQQPLRLSAQPQQPSVQPQPQIYQPVSAPDSGKAKQGVQKQSSVSSTKPPVRKKGRARGCLLISAITLVVLILLLVGGWFLAIRPYIHNMAQTQIDGMLTDVVNSIPAQTALVPAQGLVVPAKEDIINNIIKSKSSSSDPVQNVAMHITTSNISVDFQVSVFNCSVTMVPALVNGKLVATQVTVNGIVGLIFSADELTQTLNNHLADAQQRLGHSITSVQLKDQELDVTIGSGATTPGGVPSGTPPITLP